MFNTRIFRLRYFAILLLALIFAVGVYAFAALNNVDPSNAGDGFNSISGFDISNITYDTYADNDPSDIDQVSFDLTPDPGATGEVYIKLLSVGGSWYTCSPGVAPRWNCAIGGAVTTLAADELRVVAAE
jgi:hypothetical protein